VTDSKVLAILSLLRGRVAYALEISVAEGTQTDAGRVFDARLREAQCALRAVEALCST